MSDLPQPSREWIPTLDECQFQKEDLRRLRLALRKANGMVLCSGPAGCGKTTTLYACAHHLQNPASKLITIEDTVYGDLPWATRLVCSPAEGLTMDVMMRSAILAEPDAIMVPSLDLSATLNLALRAALTRQLVITQVTATTTVEALNYITERNPLPFHVADIVRLIINQRLLPKLCAECSRPAEPTKEERALLAKVRELHELAAEALPDAFHRPTGCVACEGSGYRGRIIIAELLPMTEDIADAVRDGQDEPAIRRLAFAAGARHFAVDGIHKAARGLTTLEHVRPHLAGDAFLGAC